MSTAFVYGIECLSDSNTDLYNTIMLIYHNFDKVIIACDIDDVTSVYDKMMTEKIPIDIYEVIIHENVRITREYTAAIFLYDNYKGKKIMLEFLDDEEKRLRCVSNYIVNINEEEYDCATMFDKIIKEKRSFYRTNKTKSVLVVDMDETLIINVSDDEVKLKSKNTIKLLKELMSLFDISILWTHGNKKHIEFVYSKLPELDIFDITIHRDKDLPLCKGLGFILKKLNNAFDVTTISVSCLIDDKEDNFGNDYDIYAMIPAKISDTTWDNYIKLTIETILFKITDHCAIDANFDRNRIR
jgi:hypothetical protein